MITGMVERYFQPQKLEEAEGLFAELGRRVARQSGYITGEILQSVNDSSRWTTISSWTYTDQWYRWVTAAERGELVQKMQEILVAPEKVSIHQIVG